LPDFLPRNAETSVFAGITGVYCKITQEIPAFSIKHFSALQIKERFSFPGNHQLAPEISSGKDNLFTDIPARLLFWIKKKLILLLKGLM